MVIESADRIFKPFVLGFVYATLGMLLGFLVFRSYAGLVMVFLTVMAATPYVYKTIKNEEMFDEEEKKEYSMLKQHFGAISHLMYLFLGIMIAATFWYLIMGPETTNELFRPQIDALGGLKTIEGNAIFANNFSVILFNNLKVLMFCIIFSLIYGIGAIFILTWNATVIGVAIGNIIKTNIAEYSNLIGLHGVAAYFNVISFGLLRYSIHGIPEILGYFVVALAGGILSIAMIRQDFRTKKFQGILYDTGYLLVISIALIFLAALLEVYVTPLIF